MLAPLTKRELLIIFAIIRKTYGYSKKIDRISCSQLAEITGIQRQHINMSVNRLIAANVIYSEGKMSARKIGLNKIYTEWKLDNTVPKTVTECTQNSDKEIRNTVPKTGTPMYPKQAHQCTQNSDKSVPNLGHTKEKRNFKENIKERDAYPNELNFDAWNEYMEYRKERKLTAYKPATVRKQVKWLIAQGDYYKQSQIVDQTIRNNWQGLFELKGFSNEKSGSSGKKSLAERLQDNRERFEREQGGFIIDGDDG